MNKKYLGYALIALGLGGAAYYVWGLSTASDRISLKSVSLWSVKNGKIILRMVFQNYAVVSIPFHGFNGFLNVKMNEADNDLQLGKIDVPAQGSFLASEEKALFAEVSPNWGALLSLIPNIYSVLTSGNIAQELAQYYVSVKGKLYVGNFTSDIDQRVI